MVHTTRQNTKGTILIGEDEPEVRNYLSMALTCHGFEVVVADDGSEVVNFLRDAEGGASAVLLDILMPRMDGLEALREIRKQRPDLPVIMVTGVTVPETIIEVMKSGATDYLTKPITYEQLCSSLKKALPAMWADGTADNTALTFDDPAKSHQVGWTRESETMVQQVGAADIPVLILGETGSGKEVLARRLHAHSPRAKKPFLKLNCAALPSELVESELFGYDRGAFTGAFQKKAGMFEQADGGTLLLDEIGDMDHKLQAKLLQVLQDQTFQHLGGKETVSVNVRVIAATHRDLEAAILEGTFREDLFYRLNVISFRIPALRDRGAEIIPLAEYFLEKYSPDGEPAPMLTPALRNAMLDYAWPGNIRQLENTMRRYLILRDPSLLLNELQRRVVTLPARSVSSAGAVEPTNGAPPEPVLQQFADAKAMAETQAILSALNATHWNRKQAAAMLAIDYKALLYRMKKLGIDSSRDSSSPIDGHQSEGGRKMRRVMAAGSDVVRHLAVWVLVGLLHLEPMRQWVADICEAVSLG